MVTLIPLLRRFSNSRPVRRSDPGRWPRGGAPVAAGRFSPGPLVLAVFLAFLVCPAPLSAAGQVESDADQVRAVRQRLTPDELRWRYAFGVVVTEEMPRQDRLQLGSFVRILENAVGDAPIRYLDGNEQTEWVLRILEREEREIRRRMDERTATLDRQRLERGSARGDAGTAGAEEDSQIRDLRENLRILGLVESARILLPMTAELELVRGEHRYRRVIPDAVVTARSLNVDMLLYLIVVPVEDLLFVRVRSYNRITRVDREVLRLVGTPEDLPRRLEESAPAIIREVAARDLADLRIHVTDAAGMPEEHARIRLDGTLIGVGSVEERFLVPGSYQVSVSVGDGRTADRSVELAGGEMNEIFLTLPESTAAPVVIDSEPSGAAVYQGALWVGRTPLKVPRPTEPRQYTISMEEHYDSRFQLDPDSPSRITRTLVATETDWYGQVEDTRDRFYRSFGAFAVSLAVPILLNGMYQNLGGLFPGGPARADLTLDEQERNLNRANNILVGYYASFGLSTALFGNMMWRLVQYIRTAQEYHYR